MVKPAGTVEGWKKRKAGYLLSGLSTSTRTVTPDPLPVTEPQAVVPELARLLLDLLLGVAGGTEPLAALFQLALQLFHGVVLGPEEGALLAPPRLLRAQSAAEVFCARLLLLQPVLQQLHCTAHGEGGVSAQVCHCHIQVCQSHIQLCVDNCVKKKKMYMYSAEVRDPVLESIAKQIRYSVQCTGKGRTN